MLTPGARVEPDAIKDVLKNMVRFSDDAQLAAEESMARLRELQGDGSPAVAVAAATAHELSLEKDTWGLLLVLNAAQEHDTRVAAAMRRDIIDGADPEALPGADASDHAVMEALWLKDWNYRRTDAVVQWLQEAAQARIEARSPAAFVNRGRHEAGWSCTLESLAAGGGQKSEVAYMHPDANIKKTVSGGLGESGRDGDSAVKVLRLVGQDDLDEEELMRTVWMRVRAGEMKHAKELCVNRGQPWRAAAMSGGAVVGTRVPGSGVIDGAVFSPGQGLWQDMCWQLR